MFLSTSVNLRTHSSGGFVLFFFNDTATTEIYTLSLHDALPIYTAPPAWIPLHPTVENFGRAWRSAPFGRFYVNSIVVTLVTTLGKMLNAVLCGYAFAYHRFPKKNLLFILVLCPLMI